MHSLYPFHLLFIFKDRFDPIDTQGKWSLGTDKVHFAHKMIGTHQISKMRTYLICKFDQYPCNLTALIVLQFTKTATGCCYCFRFDKYCFTTAWIGMYHAFDLSFIGCIDRNQHMAFTQTGLCIPTDKSCRLCLPYRYLHIAGNGFSGFGFVPAYIRKPARSIIFHLAGFIQYGIGFINQQGENGYLAGHKCQWGILHSSGIRPGIMQKGYYIADSLKRIHQPGYFFFRKPCRYILSYPLQGIADIQKEIDREIFFITQDL